MAYMSWHLRRSLDTYVDGESTWQDTLDTHEDTLDTHEDNHHLRRCLKWTKYLPLFVVMRMQHQLTNTTGEAVVTRRLRRLIESLEGCRADGRVVVRGETGVVPIQLKTTAGPAKTGKRKRKRKHSKRRDCFKFQHTSGYAGCLVVCCELSEGRTWVIPGGAIGRVGTLSITLGGEWDRRFAVAPERLAAALLEGERARRPRAVRAALQDAPRRGRGLRVRGWRPRSPTRSRARWTAC